MHSPILKEKTFNVNNYINCTTANVVYALFCKHCDKFIYVGETGDTLYQRHLLNLPVFRRQKPDPIAIHFNSTEHSGNDNEIVALENICGDNSYRETIEELWMNKLRTFKPHGLNTQHYCTNVFTAVADLQVQCLFI